MVGYRIVSNHAVGRGFARASSGRGHYPAKNPSRRHIEARHCRYACVEHPCERLVVTERVSKLESIAYILLSLHLLCSLRFSSPSVGQLTGRGGFGKYSGDVLEPS